ncbi:MAG: response regulator transcription factor [Dietzia sp.]|nr:response regulator transcription factor [Dietzia sp.]
MPDDAPSVLLATGDDALHEQLVGTLTAAGFALGGRCRSAASAVEAARSAGPDLVLLDARVAGDVLEAVTAVYRDRLAHTVLLMAEVDGHLLADAVIAGAAGAVAIDELRSLPASLRAVLVGEPALSRKLVARLLIEYRTRHLMGTGDGPVAVLTRREREVLELLRRGRTTQEVARELYLQPVTIRSHVAAAVRRLGVGSREEALQLLDGHDGALGR